MNREIESQKMSAQGLAIEIAAYCDGRIAAGADAALLAMAMIGCGADLLRRVASPETAADALARTAEAIAGMDMGVPKGKPS
jgi:hypothetical protein